MAVTMYTGTKGAVTSADTTLGTTGGSDQLANVDSWELSIDRTTHDSSVFETTLNATESIGGLYSGSGRLSGKADTAFVFLILTNLANISYTSSSMTLTSTTSRTFVFTAIYSEITFEIEADGLIRFNASFESTGAITVN